MSQVEILGHCPIFVEWESLLCSSRPTLCYTWLICHLSVHRIDITGGGEAGGFLYYDDSLFRLCHSNSQLWVSPVGVGGRQVASCVDVAMAVLSVDLGTLTVRLQRRDRWCFGSSPAVFVSASSESRTESDHSSDDYPVLQCVRTNNHQQIDIEIGMFQKRLISERDGASPSELHSIRICSSMYSALEKSVRDSYFGMHMGIGSRRRELDYWLDFCGIDIPMAHLWEFSEDDNVNMGASYPSGSDFISRCDLRKVTGMRYLKENMWARDESNLFCVHDFLELLPFHDGSIEDERHSPDLDEGVLSRPKVLVFISALGGSPLSVPSLSQYQEKDGEENAQCFKRASLLDVDGACTSRRLRPLEVVYELLSVISAFTTVWPHETLVLRSFWSGYDRWLSPTPSLFPSLQQLVSSSTYNEWSAGIEELWRLELDSVQGEQVAAAGSSHTQSDGQAGQQFLSRLQFGLSLSVAVSSVVVDSSLASAWLLGDGDSDREPGARMISVCNEPLLSRSCESVGGSRCFQLPLICSDDSLRSELAQLLRHTASASVLRPYMTQPSGSRVFWSMKASGSTDSSEVPLVSPVGRQLMALSSLIEFSGNTCELDGMHSFNNCSYCEVPHSSEHCDYWINRAGKLTRTSVNKVLLDHQGLLHIRNTEAKVYVQILIAISEDLGSAREIVQHWREKGPGCHFFTVYTIYVLPDCLEFSEDQNCHLRLYLHAALFTIVKLLD